MNLAGLSRIHPRRWVLICFPGKAETCCSFPAPPVISRAASLYKGRLGAELDLQQGYAAARQTMLNLLSVVKAALGDLDRVECVVKVERICQQHNRFRPAARSDQRRFRPAGTTLWGARETCPHLHRRECPSQ